MLLLPEHLTVIPWRYLTVRVVSKWNEMFPELRIAPNVHQARSETTEFVAVAVGDQHYNRMVVWGLKDNYNPDFQLECNERM